jgi:hypothetical protein
MKALNQVERRRSQWILGLLFAPMIVVVIVGTSIHYKVMALQGGDLEGKERLYNQMFETQAQKGEVMDKLIRGLQELRDSSKSFVEHQNAQKAIRSNLIMMQKIQPQVVDTQAAQLPPIPAIYDSLGASILLIQTTRDSIKTCNEQIKNLRFQLKQCLDALSKNLKEKSEDEE